MPQQVQPQRSEMHGQRQIPPQTQPGESAPTTQPLAQPSLPGSMAGQTGTDTQQPFSYAVPYSSGTDQAEAVSIPYMY
ncbi:hypothetical protein KIPB_007970 [Kipferlia bialata]|uniref:Uncharacterized protein n=1 Tax=Kipferlia bialata TaxID=797122 RepID=A0A391NXB6_9EUKA|nr:hypothetical protein KIPB_007970 [Kipferlia bialata]|eukprot:g7970.t1